MTHTCHAIGCDVPIPPALFMCKPHWFAVPTELRRQIQSHYRPGQEISKDPSPQHIEVATAAKLAVFNAETGAAGAKSLGEAMRIFRERGLVQAPVKLPPQPDFILRLRPVGDDRLSIGALRQVLKRLLRQDRLKCIEVFEAPRE